MKKLNVTSKTGRKVIIRLLDNSRVHASDYNKINEENFDYEQEYYNSFKVGSYIITKTEPTFLVPGHCNWRI
jgi:hypothetical protein